MRISAFTVLAQVIATALSCGVAHAATVLKTANRDLASNDASVTTVYAEGGKMRVETGAGPQDVVAVFKDDTLYSLNPKDRTYMAMDRAAMKKMAETLNPALKMLQQQMANMTPEQRAQMEKMMGTKLPGAAKESVEEIRKTGKTSKVAGYDCSYAEVWVDGALASELCVTPIAALQGGKELLDASVKVSALMQDMLKEIDAPWIKQMANRQVENYSKLGGVPVLGRTFDNGKPARESTLQSITTQAAPAGAFDIPAGYTRREMMPQH